MTSERAVPRVRLIPLEPAAASVRLAAATHEYGRLGARAGWWTETTADARAQQVVEGLLPQGVETPGHRFWSIALDDRSGAGWLWVGPPRHGSGWWIYDIMVDPSRRGRGIGAGALQALDARARAAGQRLIGLHVMAGNRTAHDLYLRAGYVDTEPSADGTGIVMEKRLDD